MLFWQETGIYTHNANILNNISPYINNLYLHVKVEYILNTTCTDIAILMNLTFVKYFHSVIYVTLALNVTH